MRECRCTRLRRPALQVKAVNTEKDIKRGGEMRELQASVDALQLK
jgi:hypothetical protein